LHQCRPAAAVAQWLGHSTHHPKTEGLNPTAGRDKMAGKVCIDEHEKLTEGEGSVQ